MQNHWIAQGKVGKRGSKPPGKSVGFSELRTLRTPSSQVAGLPTRPLVRPTECRKGR